MQTNQSFLGTANMYICIYVCRLACIAVFESETQKYLKRNMDIRIQYREGLEPDSEDGGWHKILNVDLQFRNKTGFFIHFSYILILAHKCTYYVHIYMHVHNISMYVHIYLQCWQKFKHFFSIKFSRSNYLINANYFLLSQQCIKWTIPNYF